MCHRKKYWNANTDSKNAGANPEFSESTSLIKWLDN